MNSTVMQNDSVPIHVQEKFIEFLLSEARTHGYIEGMTDTVEQHQQTVSKALYIRICPFMKAYKSILADKLKIQSDIRAQIDPKKYTIAIVAIMKESDYLSNLDNIYQWERALEYCLFQHFPSLSSYCIDSSVLSYSEQALLDRNLVTNDYPYVTD